MLVAHYSACEIGWHIWEQLVLEASGVVPVAGIVPVFPAGAYPGDRYTVAMKTTKRLLLPAVAQSVSVPVTPTCEPWTFKSISQSPPKIRVEILPRACLHSSTPLKHEVK